MTPAELRRRRAGAQLLAAGPAAPDRAVAHLLGVQAQDLRAARLALRARGAAGAASDVDAALNGRTLVVTWLMRGTLHLVAREDLGWLRALTGDQNAATIRRRLGQLGVNDRDAERAVTVLERAIESDGPLPRARLAERLGAAGLPSAGSSGAAPARAGGRARDDRARARWPAVSMRSRSPRDWLGAPDRTPDRDAALAELARRYLRGHGPATPADLATWTGLGLRDARAGLAAIASELEHDGDLVDLARRPEPPARVPPRLLGAFDPYLLGWKDRSFAVDPADARRVHPGGGIVRATAIARGRAVGVWTMPGGRVALEPFAPLPGTVEAALRRDAEAVARFVAPTGGT